MLTLYLGPMYAGKTSTMLTDYFRLEYKHKGFLAQHSMDTRYKTGKIITHNNHIKVDTDVFSNIKDIYEYCINGNYKLVGIEELHFFNNIKEYIEKMIKAGIIILATALNGDYRRLPWTSISEIIPLSSDIKFLKGNCEKCLASGTCSHYSKSKIGELKISNNKDFISLCSKCYYKEKNNISDDYKLIIISGRKRTGKDTVANYLVKKYGYIRLAIGDIIKEQCSEILSMLYFNNYNSSMFHSNNKDFCGFRPDDKKIIRYVNIKDPKFNHIKDREILQNYGTICRNNFGKKVFVRVLWNIIKNNTNNKYVITDNRYKDELDYLSRKCKKNNISYISWRITNSRALGNDNHESEKITFETDVYIKNNRTTLKKLYNQIDTHMTKTSDIII